MNYVAIIVTYNRLEKLKRAVDSLLAQTILPYKIIIINNASTDQTTAYLDQLEHVTARVECHTLPNNVGGAGGFYEALRLVRAMPVDWVALSDDDVRYDPHYFEIIARLQRTASQIQCFTGTVKHQDGQIQVSHRRLITNETILSQTNSTTDMYRANFYCDLFTFVGVVMSTALVRQVGLPEKDYFIWCDDTEYALRVREQTKILNVSQAVIFHDDVSTAATARNVNWKVYYGIRNEIMMTKKHSRHPELYYPVVFGHCCKKYAALLLKWRSYAPYGKTMMRLYYAAYRDGLTGRLGTNPEYLPK